MESSPGGSLRRFRLRTVEVGVVASALTVGALAVYPVLRSSREYSLAGYYALVATAAASVIVMSLLPWPRLLATPRGTSVFYAWSLFGIAMITALAALTGGQQSDLVILYALTTAFSAIAYPRASRYAVLGAAIMAYLGVSAFTPSGLDAGQAAVFVTVLVVLTLITSFLARELSSQLEQAADAEALATRRAHLLARVAEAARGMSRLDPGDVLDAVVDATLDLGFESASLCLLEADGSTWTVAHARGLPDAFAHEAHPLDEGMLGLVLEARDTVVVHDYLRNERAVPALRAEGFQSVVATPIHEGRELTGVLVVGSRERRDVDDDEIEALELLSEQAGHALDNARRFAFEYEARVRLAELDRIRTDVVSNASHELRTPLAVILGLSQTLNDRWDDLDGGRSRDMVARIAANAATLDELITTLLDMSNVDGTGIAIRAAPTDLGRLAVDVASRLQPLFDEHELRVDVGEDLVVDADAMLLERVVENLLTNARKHTPAGTSVTLACGREDGHVVMHVRDDGPGIPETDQGRLAERFYRGGDPDSRATHGLGLGLALVSEILDRHGATLEVDSRPGDGSTFGFRLPVD